MNKKILKLLTLGLIFSAAVSCGPGEKKSSKAKQEIDKSLFPVTYKSDKKIVKGGILKTAIVSDDPFKGILNRTLSTDYIDGRLMDPIAPALFMIDGNFQIINGGIFDMNLDVDNKIIDVTMRNDLKWEDGHPVTIDDYIFGYEIVGNKDYTGFRYDDGFKNVVGMEDYHSGKTKSISGLEKVNDYELKIHVKEVNPNIRAGGGGLSSYLIPKHYLSDVPIAKLEQSDKVRIKPLSYGAYKVSQVIPGESVEYIPNEYWYDKETMPKVDKFIIKVLPSSSVISSMKIGEYDTYITVPTNLYREYKNFDNLVTLGQQDLYYAYLGFNLGYWDDAKNEAVYEPSKKMADINLRKAMLYAMNINEVTKQFYDGLREKANSPIPPVFKEFHDNTPRYDYNPEKAKEILDKAGYKDIDGDGIREGKDGKPFSIKLAFPGGFDIAEPLSQKYIQDWEAVGLKVELATGRLLGTNFYPTVRSNEGYDIWMAAWSVGSAFELGSLYSKTSRFNYPRISDETNERLINEISSTKAIKDPEYRKEKVREWNNYYMDNILGFAPLLYKYDLVPINKRIKETTISYDSRVGAKFVDALTQLQPLEATK